MSTTIEHPNRRAHAGDTFADRFTPHEFRVFLGTHDDPRDPYHHCTYCGSITITDALRLFRTAGTNWSASDWKYGWPHKFYLTVPCEPYMAVVSSRYEGGKKVDVQYGTRTSHSLKFYTTHLKDATPAQIAEWNEHVAPVVGVRFEPEGDALRYYAERGASGRFGVIAESNAPA